MRLELEQSGGVHRIRVKGTRLTYPMLSAFFTQVRGVVAGERATC